MITAISNYHKFGEAKRSLKYSFGDGVGYSAMTGLSQDYIVPYALVLGASHTHIGLLTSIPVLAGALSQLKAGDLARRVGGRKKSILIIDFIQGLLWIPVILLPYLLDGSAVLWLIALFTVYFVFDQMDNPMWSSWMADLVPRGIRGKYFGLRGMVCGAATWVFALVGGTVLQVLSGKAFLGFTAIFLGAMLFRFFSWYFESRMYEPPLRVSKEKRVGVLEFLRRMKSSNLGRFIVYIALINFSLGLVGPFFAVYLLEDLKLDYVSYMAIVAAATLATLVSFLFWGKIADKAGNIRVISLTSWVLPLIPLLWIVGSQAPYIFLVTVQVVSGIALAGFNLCSSNFIYEATPSEGRTTYFGYFNAITGIALFLGTFIGAYLVGFLPPLLGYPLLTLFLISALLRAMVVKNILHSVKEVRQVRRMTTWELLVGDLGLRLLKAKRVVKQLYYSVSLTLKDLCWIIPCWLSRLFVLKFRQRLAECGPP